MQDVRPVARPEFPVEVDLAERLVRRGVPVQAPDALEGRAVDLATLGAPAVEVLRVGGLESGGPLGEHGRGHGALPLVRAPWR